MAAPGWVGPATSGALPFGLLGATPVSTAQPTRYRLTGTTVDSAGAVLPTCVVQVFRTVDDVIVAEVVSNANGLYDVTVPGEAGRTFYCVAYKASAPDVMGTTVNTLVAVVA